jgi:hypothetical protein
MSEAQHRIKSTVFSHDIDDIDSVPDLLRRESIVAEILKELRSDDPAQIIGVYGWWGSGKTYLLSQVIKRSLDSNNENPRARQIIVCTFKAWRYEMENNLAGGLIRSLVDVDKHNKALKSPKSEVKPYLKTAAELLKQISSVASSFGVAGQAIGAVGGFVAEHVKESIEKGEIIPSTVDAIQDTMQQLVEDILAYAAAKNPLNKDYRIVMFIDDLDRCSPENMVRMFEWLKVHLRVRNCIYVMGLDNTAAARAIVGKYKEYLGGTEDVSYGFRYLEKLVDSEYELGIAPFAEAMAVKRVFEKEECYYEHARLSDIAHKMTGGFFRGEDKMKDLLGMRSLHPPRTMLKIVKKYKRAISSLDSPSAESLRKQLTESYPFWTLFLIALYYRLEPRYLADFIREKGIIYDLMKQSGQAGAQSWGEPPLYEFCEFANRFGSNIKVPGTGALRQLAATILGNSPATYE